MSATRERGRAGSPAVEPDLQPDLQPGQGSMLACLGVLAIAVRGVAWLRTAALFDDGPVFLSLAQSIVDGDGSSALRHPYHPLYPALVAGLSLLGPGLENAAAALSAAAGGAAVVAFALWLDEAFGRATAWTGGAILALHPYAVSFSCDVQSDGLYLALFLWSALFLYRAPRTGRWTDAAAAGAFSGLAYLARPEGLGLALLGALGGAVWIGRGDGRARARAVALAALLAAALVPAALYTTALRLETGAWQLTQKKSVAGLAGRSADARPAPATPLRRPGTLPRAGDRPPPRTPGERLAAASWDFYRSSVSVFRFELLPFLALGLFAARGRPGWRAVFVGGIGLAYAAVLAALALGAGYVSRRHALPPLVPLMGYAASGLVFGVGWMVSRLGLTGRAAGPARSWLAPLVIAALLAAAWGPRDLAPRRLDRLAERRAAEWLRDGDHDPGPVAAGRLRVAYYAGRPFVPLPSAPKGGMLAYLQSHAVRWVIVDESKLDAHQGLRQAKAHGLERVHRVVEAGHTASVYRVPAAPPRSRGPCGSTSRPGECGAGPPGRSP
ncbi:MAG: glycosyltransferase family 39 protein [Myxococcota bacterium]